MGLLCLWIRHKCRPTCTFCCNESQTAYLPVRNLNASSHSAHTRYVSIGSLCWSWWKSCHVWVEKIFSQTSHLKGNFSESSTLGMHSSFWNLMLRPGKSSSSSKRLRLRLPLRFFLGIGGRPSFLGRPTGRLNPEGHVRLTGGFTGSSCDVDWASFTSLFSPCCSVVSPLGPEKNSYKSM